MPSDWAFVSVDMELTNRCSTDCLMCPRDAITRPKGMMSEGVFKAVSEKLIGEGSLLTFSGMGDPLSHPNVFEWIYEIRRKGGDVGIVINPASLNMEISQKLVESSPNSITLSFPSLRKSVFKKLCPKVSYDDAFKRTLELIDIARGNVGLRVTGIISGVNSGEQEGYVSFWKERGVGSSMTVCHGRGGNLRAPGIYKPQSIGLESGICSLFQFHTFVTWEGEALACCHDLAGATRIGSMVNDDVSVIAERKRKVIKNSMHFPVCGQCDEPLRQCQTPQGLPPEGRKERISFFRSARLNQSYNYRSQAGAWERGDFFVQSARRKLFCQALSNVPKPELRNEERAEFGNEEIVPKPELRNERRVGSYNFTSLNLLLFLLR